MRLNFKGVDDDLEYVIRFIMNSGTVVWVEVTGTASAQAEIEAINHLLNDGSANRQYYFEYDNTIVKIREVAAVQVTQKYEN